MHKLKFGQPKTIFPPYLQHGKPFWCLWRLRPKPECKAHGSCQRNRTEAEKQEFTMVSFLRSGFSSLLCRFSRGRCLSPLLNCSCLIVGQRLDLSWRRKNGIGFDFRIERITCVWVKMTPRLWKPVHFSFLWILRGPTRISQTAKL